MSAETSMLTETSSWVVDITAARTMGTVGVTGVAGGGLMVLAHAGG